MLTEKPLGLSGFFFSEIAEDKRSTQTLTLS